MKNKIRLTSFNKKMKIRNKLQGLFHLIILEEEKEEELDEIVERVFKEEAIEKRVPLSLRLIA